MNLFDFWAELSPWTRNGIAILLLLVSTVLYFAFHRFWPWGWGVGAVLLLFGGRSDPEKKGYRF